MANMVFGDSEVRVVIDQNQEGQASHWAEGKTVEQAVATLCGICFAKGTAKGQFEFRNSATPIPTTMAVVRKMHRDSQAAKKKFNGW